MSDVEPKKKKVIGEPVVGLTMGDRVRVHLEMCGQTFDAYPHNHEGIVLSLTHEDDEYFYNFPVIVMVNRCGDTVEKRMFIQKHLRKM